LAEALISLTRLLNRWTLIDPAAAKNWAEKSGAAGGVKLPPP
jgi:hypothetical protein